MSTLTPEQIQQMRQENIGRLLLRAYRGFNERAFEKLQAYGHADLGITHAAVLPHLDIDGTHISVLAERAGITKQAMGQLVEELEKKGYVYRQPDPQDRRATLILFTQRGQQFLVDAYHTKEAIEAEYTALLGDEGMTQLRQALLLLSQL